MKKFRGMICVIAVLSLLVTGCGLSAGGGQATVTLDGTEVAETTNGVSEATPTSGTVSLRVWGAEEDAALLAQIIESFKAEYGSQATFEITVEAAAESECKDLILGDISNAPDVFTFADDQLASLAASGVLEPIQYNVDSVATRNSESSVTAASVNGELYAYPLTADNGYFLFYNKAYFTDEDLQTLDAILAVAAENGKKVTMDWGSGWYLYSFFGNTGLEVGLNDDGISNYCTWNATDNAVTGVDVCNAMMAIAANPGFMNGGDDALKEGAADDSVIAGVSGVWCASDLSATWGSNYGAVKLPTYTVAGTQVQMSSYAGYKMVGVNSYSENRYWAEVLAEYITNEQNQTLRFEMREQGPSNVNAASSDAVAASPAIQALISQSEFASLQRIGGNYWGPAATLGETMYNQNSSGQDLQEFLDGIVADITASNS